MKRSVLVGVLLFVTPFFVHAQTPTCPTITQYLTIGSRTAQVITLKKYLAQEKLLTGVSNTNYFGPSTAAALKVWQKKKGIDATGATGPKTRAALKNCRSTIAVLPAQPKPQTPKTTPPVHTPKTLPPAGGGGGSVPIAPQYSWVTQPWGSCVNSMQSRTVTCTSDAGIEAADSVCTVPKPATIQTCTLGAGTTACTFNGNTVSHGASVIAYESATVAFDSRCKQETRMCTNGVLSGTYIHAACVPNDAPADVTLNVSPQGTPYSLKTALVAAKNLPQQVKTITIKLADGTYDMSAASMDMCGVVPCISFAGFVNPARLKIIGNTEHPERVVLAFKAPQQGYWPGGFYMYEQKIYPYFDGFTMQGPYNGWASRDARTPVTTAFPSADQITFTTMAFWARNGAQVTIGPHVRIAGFYFGIAAEGVGTVVTANGVQVSGCGDAGFIAWTGGVIHAHDSEASWCAAFGWGLGTGYVAETLNPHDVASYADDNPDTDDAAIRTYTYNYALGVRSSVETPLLQLVDKRIRDYGTRSRINAERSRAHDNLIAGYLSNIGGSIEAQSASAYRNGLSSVPTPSPILKGGFVAQINGRIAAPASMSFHNANYGYAALLGSEINADTAYAFGNTLHGMYTLEAGSSISARGSDAFSFGAAQRYGFGAERTGKVYINATTKSGAGAQPFTFFNPMTGGDTRVIPVAHTDWDYYPALGNTDASGSAIITDQ
jgi:hypothetical protein